MSLGNWWAFSSVVGPLDGLARWPCLGGAPFYVLDIEGLSIHATPAGPTTTSYVPTALRISGVLPNPCELTDESLTSPPTLKPPQPVAEAAASGLRVSITIPVNQLAQMPPTLSGSFSWPFSVAAQESLSAVPGQLQTLAGTVHSDLTSNTLSVQPKAAQCAITAFARNWPAAADPPELTATATFDPKTGERLSLTFAAAAPATFALNLHVPPTFDPTVAFGQIANRYPLQGSVDSAAGVKLEVDLGSGFVRALPALEQGLYSTFLIGEVSDVDEQINTGSAVLALWPEGLDTPFLGAILVLEQRLSDRQASLGNLTVSGPCVTLEVLASGAGTPDAKGSPGPPVWRHAEFFTWLLLPPGANPAFELFLVDQCLSDDPDSSGGNSTQTVSAWLTLNSVPAQGPLRLKASLSGADDVALEPDLGWYLASKVTWPAQESQNGGEVIGFPDNGPLFRSVPLSADPSAETPERVRLTFDGTTFSLDRIDPSEVPLDECVDADANHPPLTASRRSPVLVFAGEPSEVLRLAMPPTDRLFSKEPSIPPTALPPPARAAAWALSPLVQVQGTAATNDRCDSTLSPLVQVQDRLIVRRPPALPRPTKQPPPVRTENALVAHRPPRAGATAFPSSPVVDPDVLPSGYPDPTAPLVGLFSLSVAGLDVTGFDLQLIPDLSKLPLPTSGTNLVVIAKAKDPLTHGDLLYFRIFDEGGKVIVDTNESRATTEAGALANLKNELTNLWPPHVLTSQERAQVLDAATQVFKAPPLLTEARIRTLLEKTGTAGLALRRILRDNNFPTQFQVIHSPFLRPRECCKAADRAAHRGDRFQRAAPSPRARFR